MKHLLSVLICTLALPLFSQTPATPAPATPTQVAVSGADKDKIELAMVKLENTQLRAALTKDEAKLQLHDLAQEAVTGKADYDSKLAEVRASLKVPDNAQFDTEKFLFVVPPTPPVPTPTAVPTK